MGRLSRFQRITQQRDFDRIYRRADRVWHTPWFVLFYQKDSSYMVAFVAGKKVGKAVARNRAKRRLRALFQEQIERYRSGSYIIVAKKAIIEAEFATLKEAWIRALMRAGALGAHSDSKRSRL